MYHSIFLLASFIIFIPSLHLQKLEDVNEYAPKFRQKSYTVSVPEGRLIDPVIQVTALDHDHSTKYSQICKYEIIGGDKLASPFEIDASGNIKNTRPLAWKESHNYILEVVAYDCGLKRSKPALVNIKVNKVCQPGWKGMPERIEYLPSSWSKILFPDAELQTCEVPCDTRNISIRLTMATRHIGKGCDRDTYSVQSQRKLCGANVEAVDLLPSPGMGTEWTKDLPTDEGKESDQTFRFDGLTNAVVIKETTLDHNITEKFTISFWMKHEPPLDRDNKHIKEHILCNADDHKKNRHHYALFVRNCRLILLLRREMGQDRRTVFKPAEWRWKLSETCDNEWHHLAVNVNFPDVTLFVDGSRFKNSSSNPEIVDDWPLHGMKDIQTTLVVGACWKGRSGKMNFMFRGYLAGLSILRGANEKPEVLRCLHRCKEGLQLPPPDTLEPETDVSINSEATEIFLEGSDSIDVEDMLSQITYINSREFPTPGRRNIRLYTSIKCSNGKSLKISPVDSYIMVLPPQQPSITLNGTPNLAREYEAFVQGIQLFSTVSILVNHQKVSGDEELDMSGEQDSLENSSQEGVRDKLMRVHKLDTCTIQVYPPLNPDHEYFRLPINFMIHLGVRFKETKDGIVIYGADSARNYQSILGQIVYFNRKPAYYLNRAFKLTCSELNGRFVSNDYIQTLTVIHPKLDNQAGLFKNSASLNEVLASGELASEGNGKSIGQVAHAQVHQHKVEMKDSKIKSGPVSFLQSSGLIDSGNSYGRASAMNHSRVSPIVVGHAVTVIIVVCVGFLVFMIVLGVIRIRAAHHRSNENRDDEQEMAWDDSSLTITVNPLDQIEQEPEQQPLNEDEDESDNSEDGSSYHDDGDSSEEENVKSKVSRRELEWDDSTLNF